MKKLIIPGAVCFLFVCNACWMTDDCGENGSGCHGSVNVWCEDGNNDAPMEYDCAEEGLSCARLTSGDYDCVLPCSKSEIGLVIDAACADPFTLEGFFCIENSAHMMANTGERYYYQFQTMSCSHGCLDNACVKLHLDEYEYCDSSYGSSCDGSVVGHCEDGLVHAYDCDADHSGQMTCGIINNEATCVEQCHPDRFGEPKSVCEERGDGAYRVVTSCESDGAIYYLHTEEEKCIHGCYAKTGQCKVHPDEGEPCTAESCFGDIHLYCGTDNVMHAVDCRAYYQSQGGEWSCAEISRDGDSFVACRQICPASQANTSTGVCKYNEETSYSVVTKCIASNINYIEEETISCEHGCNRLDGACLKLVQEEGDACNYSMLNYQTHCNNDIRVYCGNDNKVHATDCKADNSKVCIEIDDRHADCVEATGCGIRTVGNTRMACIGPNLTGEEICRKSGEQYVWEENDRPTQVGEYCEHGCDSASGKCVFIHEDEHQACDASNDKPYCDGNYLLQCSNYKMLYATDCSEQEQRCATIDGEAGCYASCNAAQVNQIVQKCGMFNSLISYECIKTGNDYLLKEVSTRSCLNGCQNDTNTCKVIDPQEGAVCTESGYTPSCSDNDRHLLKCVSGYVQAQDCTASEDGICMILDSGTASCERACSADKIGSFIGTCVTESGFIGAECVKEGDNYYYQSRILSCANGCDPEKPGCKPE